MGRQEVVDVLAAQHVRERVLLLSFGTLLQDHALVGPNVASVGVGPNLDHFIVCRQIARGKFGRVRLHGEPMVGGGPQLIEAFVALTAALGTDVAIGTFGRGNGRRQRGSDP